MARRKNNVISAENIKNIQESVDNLETRVLQPSLNTPSANKPSENKPSQRPKERIALRDQRRVYFTGCEKGYHYHIVNDKENRISSFMAAGFEIVEGENKDQLKGLVSSHQLGSTAAFDVGGGVTAYRMRTTTERWEKDNAAHIEETKQVDYEIAGETPPKNIIKSTAGGSVESDKYYIKK